MNKTEKDGEKQTKKIKIPRTPNVTNGRYIAILSNTPQAGVKRLRQCTRSPKCALPALIQSSPGLSRAMGCEFGWVCSYLELTKEGRSCEGANNPARFSEEICLSEGFLS